MLCVSSSSNRASHGDGSHDRGFPLFPHAPAVAPGTVPGSPARQSLVEADTRLQAGVAISPSCLALESSQYATQTETPVLHLASVRLRLRLT